MASIKDSLRLVIDLEGFFVQKKFQVREMSNYSWNDYFGRYAFFQQTALKDLSDSLINPVTERELMSMIKQILFYCDCTINTRLLKELW